jgi:two-component system LytT family sensor kinase
MRGWMKWVLIGFAWTLYGVFFASESIVTRAYFGRPLDFGGTLASWLVCALVWLAATPVILKLARHFPLDTGDWIKNAAIHLFAGCGFAIVLLAIYVVIASVVGLLPNRPLVEAFRNQVVSSFHAEVLTYWAVIGLTHALDYYRKYRERELRASQLEAQLARAQLDALKMQLQPHFLFNTLNTISVLMKEDVVVANRLLLRLSDLLRLALRNSDAHEVSLQEELQFLRSYLEIEQTRFQDRLSVHYQIDEQAVDAQVPNLILQPLVENAIRHAVAPRAGKSTVEIRATRRNGNVELQVCDDGPGMKPASANANGIGLTNTRARLDKLYGSSHLFTLSPANGGGLKVTVSFPYRTAPANVEKSHGQDPRAAG